jgi:predicted dehydrogenase
VQSPAPGIGIVRKSRPAGKGAGIPHHAACPLGDYDDLVTLPTPVRLAFIGTGDWARASHLPALAYIRENLSETVQLSLRGIYGIDVEQAESLRSQYGFEQRYTSLEALLADSALDAAAVVISPSATREVVLKIHAARPLAILTEKPPGATYAEALDLAERVTGTHLVAFNRRYKPLNNQFRDRLAEAGPVRSMQAWMVRRDRREPEFIRHTGIHLINYVEYLFGPITSVRTVVTGNRGDEGTRHEAHVGFASKVAGKIMFAPRFGDQQEGVEVETAVGKLSIRCPLNDDPGEIEIERGDVTLTDAGDPALPAVVREGFVEEYLELFRAMAGSSSVRSTFQSSANCMRIAEAIDRGETIG